MSESVAVNSDVALIRSVATTIGIFINNSYELRFVLNEVAKKPKDERTRIRNWSLSTGAWCCVVRWLKLYGPAWHVIGKVRELADKRWGNSQRWIDEFRADLYRFSVPFFFPGSPDSLDAVVLRKAFLDWEKLEEEQIEVTRLWEAEYATAMERASKSGVGAMFGSKFQESEEKYMAFSSDWAARLEQWGSKLKGHLYIWRFVQFVDQTRWKALFDSRLESIQFRAATLAAMCAGDEPTMEIKDDQGRYSDIQREILDAVRKNPQGLRRIEDIAGVAGYPPDSRFRSEVATLKRFGLLEKIEKRYVLKK